MGEQVPSPGANSIPKSSVYRFNFFLNQLIDTGQMRGQNICFDGKKKKNYL